MLNTILRSDNPLVRYGFSTLIVFGSLYFLSATGIVPTKVTWLISVIILVMVLMIQVGGKGAKFA